jgi:hypothetical protein
MMYFEAVVVFKTQQEEKVKKERKNYLVDAMSVTEAEAKLVEKFEQTGGLGEYKVLGIKKSKVIDTLLSEEGDPKFYEVTVEVTIESEGKGDSVRVKKMKELFVIEANKTSDIENKVKEIYRFSPDQYEIIAIKKSKIEEIVKHQENE